MLVSHKHKLITIDIPKTGTRSLRESLLPVGIIDIIGEPSPSAEFYQHDHATRAEKQFIKNNWCWDDYFKFTVVRNPWQRYFSFFKYFKDYADKFIAQDSKTTWNAPEIKQGKQCVKMFESCDERSVLETIITNNDPQHVFFVDSNNKIMVDHVACFEDIETEFKYLCDKISIQVPELMHSNKSTAKLGLHDVYDQQLIDLVAKKDAEVISLKNYQI